jgi:hypothetical protein
VVKPTVGAVGTLFSQSALSEPNDLIDDVLPHEFESRSEWITMFEGLLLFVLIQPVIDERVLGVVSLYG